MQVDVAVVGGGIAGTMIARELSRYRLRVAVLEREAEVGLGCTKASNSVVHASAGAGGSKTARLAAESQPLFDQLCTDLEVPLKRCGELFVALEDGELPMLEQFLRAGHERDIPMRRLDREQTLALEPALSPEVLAGVLAPSGAILYSFELAIALYENAAHNGVTFLFDAEVQDAREVASGDIELRTPTETVTARFVVNAAGIWAGRVAHLLADDTLEVWGEKGERVVLDRRCEGLVRHVIDRADGAGLVVPTLHGNLFLGRWEGGSDRDDERAFTSAQGIEGILREARRLVPAIERRDMIRAFAGVMACNARDDQIVEASSRCPRLVHACLQPPGVTVSPAVAQEVVGILGGLGLHLQPNERFEPHRQAIPDFSEMTAEERSELIARDPRFGQLVCRCETVTEGEIVEAIRRGARTLDGVKYRVRAGMGRCQGGFCGPRVMRILARELALDATAVTKKGSDSWLAATRAGAATGCAERRDERGGVAGGRD